MDLVRIPIGADPPHEVNVVVEIPQGGAPVKYEIDKQSGAMFVNVSCIQRCSIREITALFPTPCRRMEIQSTAS